MLLRGYVDPKSLRDKRKRYFVRLASKHNSKLIINLLGRENDYFKATVLIEGHKEFFDLLKKNHIKIRKKPIPMLMSSAVFAELQVDPLGDLVVGKNSLGFPVGVSLNQQLITNVEQVPLYASSKYPTLWLDFRGSNKALFCGFEEFVGFPLKVGESKLHDIAHKIAKLLKVPLESAISVLTSYELLGDEEIELTIPTSIQNVLSWKILDLEDKPSSKIYIDFSGLPRNYYRLVMGIAEAFWDDLIVIELPAIIDLELLGIKSKSKRIILVDQVDREFEGTILLKKEVIWNIKFRDQIISYSEEYSALWENKDE